MKNFLVLKVLDRMKGLFTMMGVDYPVMRKMLAIKLTMDTRRVPTIFNQKSQKKKQREGNSFVKSLWIYALMGLLVTPLVISGENYLFQMSALFGITMFIVMTSMISDFSSVLLDIRDKTILLTKPVNKRTINFAKAVHISIYLIFLSFSLNAAPLLIGFFLHGPLFFSIFMLAIILANLLVLVLTAITYFFILRYFDGEKLKDMINYVQILLSIAMAVGYQLVGRSFQFIHAKVGFSPEWWHLFLPPVWFGSAFEMMMKGDSSSFLMFFSLLAIIVPLVSVAIYIKMMPAFERNLQKLSGTSVENRKRRGKLENSFSKLLCPGNEERMFYRFAVKMVKNEREYKLKVYPGLGLSLVLPFVPLANQLQFQTFSSIADSKSYLAIYMSNLAIPTAIMMLKYSGNYKGAWIFKTSPLQSFAPLYSGTLKAYIVKLFLPVYILLSIIFVSIFGMKIVPDVISVFLFSIVYTVICSGMLKDSFPFSEPFEAASQSDSWKIIMYLLVIAVFAGIHYAFTFVQKGGLIFMVMMFLISIISWQIAYRKLWKA